MPPPSTRTVARPAMQPGSVNKVVRCIMPLSCFPAEREWFPSLVSPGLSRAGALRCSAFLQETNEVIAQAVIVRMIEHLYPRARTWERHCEDLPHRGRWTTGHHDYAVSQ